jgi:putative transposase
LKARLQPGWRLSDGERATLAEIARRLGRKGLLEVARIAKPDTIPAWYRQLVAKKFDGSKQRRSPGRLRTSSEIEDVVVRLARENSGWGYDRIAGALTNLGYQVSDQTVDNILRRQGIGPVPQRSTTTTWKDFIRRHMDVLAGTDFFTVEVLTWRGLVTYYVLFFIPLDSRRVSIAGITDHPKACWMRQVACNATFEGIGHRNGWLLVARSRCQVRR